MIKKYKLLNLGCANCASKMEEKIKKLDGVNDANINFMTSKLIIDVKEEKLSEVLLESEKIIKTIEPYCSIGK
ncbi:MAG: heavy-metal-associated domain-containing protein [Peptoniphilaceae bacterium]|nr:heavy-metal-associated domain-containing protein [Peptoniphilaceae bacterium]MDY3737547.1 heavy-metal-associated domain-containing protein [Peptoniphilaceae bacterium]